MGIETAFEDNDLTKDQTRYERILNLRKKNPDIKLWGVTNAFANAVNKRFKIIRKKNWPEKINLNILIINNLKGIKKVRILTIAK